jgi:hypothetical protein
MELLDNRKYTNESRESGFRRFKVARFRKTEHANTSHIKGNETRIAHSDLPKQYKRKPGEWKELMRDNLEDFVMCKVEGTDAKVGFAVVNAKSHCWIKFFFLFCSFSPLLS